MKDIELKMPFLKKCEIRDEINRLGAKQKGIYAAEPIKKGEKIWHCDCGDKDDAFTRDQLIGFIDKYPRLDYFVRSFSYMIDDDLYALPYTFMDEKNNDECALFNHSCDPNCGFADAALGDNFVAIRNIEPGEEITYHYGYLETESSLIYGLPCKCFSANCCGRLTFDYYRDPEFVEKHFHYMTGYLKQKVIDMRERWYSTDCYVKRVPNQELNHTFDNIEEWDKALFSLRFIKKGTLVASFPLANTNEDIKVGHHFIRHSTQPNCVLIGTDVYTTVDVPKDLELSMYYS